MTRAPHLRRLVRSILITAAAALALMLPLRGGQAPIEDDRRIQASILELPNPVLQDNTATAPTVWSEALARPVFSPDRRPFVPAAPEPDIALPEEPEASHPAPPTAPVELIGVLIHDAGRKALLTSPSSPDGEWLRVGGNVAGWKVMRIDTSSVALWNSAGSLTLQLHVDNASVE